MMSTSLVDVPGSTAHSGGAGEAGWETPVQVCSQSRDYPAVADSCAHARADVASTLSAAGLAAEDIEVARVIASELFTNALIHHRVRDGEMVKLIVSTSPQSDGVWVVLTVVDAGGGTLGCGDVDGIDVDEHGRGLALVRGLGAQVAGRLVAGGFRVQARFPAVASRRCSALA